MAQTDYDIVDQTGLSFLADLNDTLDAIVSNNSGATEPATTFAYMWWADTTSGVLKQRNAANSAWLDKYKLNGGELAELAGATFTGDISATNLSGTNTGDQDLSGKANIAGQVFTGDIVAPGLDIEKSNPTGGGFLSIVNTDRGFTGKIADIIFKISDSVGTKKDAAYIQAIPNSVDVNTGASLSFFTRKGNDTPSESMTIGAGGDVYPGSDNTRALGTASLRWSEVFAGTGTINTSDAREKTPVRGMNESEVSAAKDMSKEIGIYQFLASVEKKGDNARQHVGLTVQRAVEIMTAHGLEPFSYGFICFDAWDDIFVEHAEILAVEASEGVESVEAKAAWTDQTQVAGNRYGFRYDQLNLFIARGIEARLSALEDNA